MPALRFAAHSPTASFPVAMTARPSAKPSLTAQEIGASMPPTMRQITPWPYSCQMMSASKLPARVGVVYVHLYICMRGAPPSPVTML